MKKFFSVSRQHTLAAAALGLAIVAGARPAFADGVALPDTGTDLTDWIPVLITGFGAIVALIVGGAFAFKLIWKGISKATKALG